MKKIKRSLLPVLRKEQLQIMDVIHDICIKNGITYYMIGGTALGAMRHKGFIPWDIDIDIAMPRKDYLLFKTISKSESPEGYSFMDYNDDKYCHTNHGFYTYKSKRVDAVGGGAKFGVFIDIFPLDFAPNDFNEQKKHAKRIRNLRKIEYYFSHSYIPSIKPHIRFKKIAKIISRGIQSIYSLQKLNKKIDSVMQLYNAVGSNYLCSMCSHYSYEKQCMDKNIYGEPQLVRFEDKEYYAPQNLHEYLHRIFGNYMKIPSIEEQNLWLED